MVFYNLVVFFSGGMVKLTSSLMTVVPKIHRKVIKVAGKRPTTIHRPLTGKFSMFIDCVLMNFNT